MNTEQAEEWIDIDEAVKLTGRSRRTLMRWKKERKVAARTVDQEFVQRQRRTEFSKGDLTKAITEGV